MRWTFLIVLTCLCLCGDIDNVKCHPVSSDVEEDDRGDYPTDQLNDINDLPQSQLIPPLTEELFKLSLPNVTFNNFNNSSFNNASASNSDQPQEQDLSSEASHHHDEQMVYEGSNPFVNVLKALNLPTTFAEPSLSSEKSSTVAPGPIASFFQAITPSSSSTSSFTSESSPSSSSTSETPGTETTTNPSSPSPPSAASSVFAAGLPNLNPNEQKSPPLKYMTGNGMLDKIMNCPCDKEQLSAVGIRGVAYSNAPDAAIYRDPPYTMDMLGPGDHIAGNLKNVGGKTGNVFGQVIRLIIGLPTQALSVLKPLVTGFADTWAATTEAAAEVAGQKAKAIPTALRSTAVVIKKLLETFGDVTGTLLHVLANIIASLAAAKSSVAGTLPFAFDGIGDMLKGISSQVGAAVDLVSGTSEILSGGVINAAKTTGNLLVGLVEGGKGFQLGLLEGIKYGINDEPQPNTGGANGQGWRRK